MVKPNFSKEDLKIYSVKHLVKILNVIRNEGLNISGKFYAWQLKDITFENKRYKKIEIPKKSRGKRELYIPDITLGFIQYCISILLSYYYKPNKNCFGYVKGRSIVDNASKHIGKDVIVNIDLKDFFGSIDIYKIQDKLTDFPFNFSEEVAELLSQLVTVKSDKKYLNPYGEIVNRTFLPQGSPCSPIISNIVADNLDFRLSRLSLKCGFTYSRYVDDLTFSFNTSFIHEWYNYEDYYGLINLIKDIIRDEQFEINERKTRTSYSNQRHEVTGLIVNKKVNIKRSYIKNIRTILHNWEKDGYGNASMLYFLKSKKCKNSFPNLENSVSGMLSYIKMVKGEEDSTYLKLYDRFIKLCVRDKESLNLSSEIDNIIHNKSNENDFIPEKLKIGSEYCLNYIIKSCKPFSEDWINAVKKAQICERKFAEWEVHFTMQRGYKKISKYFLLGVYSIAKLRIGDLIDPQKALLLTVYHKNKNIELKFVEIL